MRSIVVFNDNIIYWLAKLFYETETTLGSFFREISDNY